MRRFIAFFLLLISFKTWSISFDVLVPKHLRPDPTLVTLLHGCTQSAKSFRGQTHLESYIDAKNIVLLTPSQSVMRNPIKCWNWFTLQNNDELYREFEEVKLLVQKMMSTYGVKKSYLMGFSAGGAMASNLIALSSDLFDGVLIHSGFPHLGMKFMDLDLPLKLQNGDMWLRDFLSSVSKKEEDKIQDLRSLIHPLHSRLKTIIIASGKKDKIALHRFSKSIFFQFADMDSYLTVRSFDHYDVYRASSRDRNVYLYEFPQMGHAWSGGSADYLFSSPDTLDITFESFKIFGL